MVHFFYHNWVIRKFHNMIFGCLVEVMHGYVQLGAGDTLLRSAPIKADTRTHNIVDLDTLWLMCPEVHHKVTEWRNKVDMDDCDILGPASCQTLLLIPHIAPACVQPSDMQELLFWWIFGLLKMSTGSFFIDKLLTLAFINPFGRLPVCGGGVAQAACRLRSCCCSAKQLEEMRGTHLEAERVRSNYVWCYLLHFLFFFTFYSLCYIKQI